MLVRYVRILFSACFLIIAVGGCKPAEHAAKEPAASESAAVSEEESGGIIDKKTQEVLKLEDALADGAVLASSGIETNNPLLQNAAAYRTTVAKVGSMAVDQAIQLRNAQSVQDPKPLTHELFMAEIIKKGQPDGIQLAKLPYYQEYAWDEPNQKLVVVEFPARKEERQSQR